MSASLLPTIQQWFDANGNPLSNGKVYTYIAGTSTPKTTWADYDKNATNTNPVILDAAGRAQIWGDGGYKIVVTDENDVVIDTQDDVFAFGNTVSGNFDVTGDVTIGGDLAVGGTLDVGDDLTLDGGFAMTSQAADDTFVIDHTGVTTVPPVHIFHSNIFSNSPTPYGSGSVLIEAKGLNNNQPLLFLRKNIATTTFGNGANMILENSGGPTNAAGTRFSVDFEFVANNSAINNFNGKFEMGGSSGVTGGATIAEGGFWYLASRRGPKAPEGQNTGFERFVNIYNLDYGGEIESLGNGISITPKYTNSQAFLTINNSFAASRITASSTAAAAELFLTTTGANQNANFTMTTGSGTASATMNFNDGADTNKGWRIQYATSNNRLNIQPKIGGSFVAASYFDLNSDGLFVVPRAADATKGRIRLSTGGGAAGGGIFEYDSNTGQLSISGTNNYITTGSNGYIESTRFENAAPASGDTVTPGAFISDFIITSGALAALTVQLPTSVQNGHAISVICTGAITALSVTAAGGATVLGGPTTLPSNGYFTMIYRSAVNTWYRKG